MSPYSRTTSVTAIHSFYAYLSAIGAIPSHSINTPPSTGWPDISASTLSVLNKDSQVVDLLRHLPYIANDLDGNHSIAFETRPIRYNESDIRWTHGANPRMLQGVLIPVNAGDVPPHVAVITCGGKDGSWLLLDTHEGTITNFVMFGSPVRDDPPKDSPDYWRAYETLPVVEFFEAWKEKFRALEWLALPHNHDDGIVYAESRNGKEVSEIYLAHGWPDNFRLEECKQALREWEDKKWA